MRLESQRPVAIHYIGANRKLREVLGGKSSKYHTSVPWGGGGGHKSLT